MLDSDWNDTGFPLAHLFTFRCYGTWLHGDDRGSIDKFNNKFESPYLPPNRKWHEFTSGILKQKPVRLTEAMRVCVERAIRETCKIRCWDLCAVNVRTNHVHIVVSIGVDSSRKALTAFKANATRIMREDQLWEFDVSPWARNGSRIFLWNEKSVEIAVDYVLNRQGRPLPDFGLNQCSEP